MIFSYGFIENTMTSAKELFLDLHPSEDDPLGMAKARVSTAAPGVKLSEKALDAHNTTAVEWYSDFVWLICVNEEDGLDFRVLQSNDGGRELKTYWKDEELKDTSAIRDLLQQDPLWEVYQLRAVVLVQQRIEEQLQVLYETSNDERFQHEDDHAIRTGPRKLALKLRDLESKLLEKAYASLDNEVGLCACHEHVVSALTVRRKQLLSGQRLFTNIWRTQQRKRKQLQETTTKREMISHKMKNLSCQSILYVHNLPSEYSANAVNNLRLDHGQITACDAGLESCKPSSLKWSGRSSVVKIQYAPQ
jgi:hypothetical protein